MKMLKMILQHVFRGSVTTRFPDRPAVSEGYRGLVQFDASRCSGCSMCAFHCTSRAITFRATKAEYKWSYDAGQCTFCAACVQGCESLALRMEQACPPVYLASGALKCSYSMQRKQPAPKPATAPAVVPSPAAGGTQ